MSHLLISTPKKAHKKLLKMRSEMDEFLSKKDEHDLRKSQPKELSFVDHLSAIGHPSDWTSRRKLAEKFGIKDYVGTSHQHGRMQAILNANTHATNPSNTTK